MLHLEEEEGEAIGLGAAPDRIIASVVASTQRYSPELQKLFSALDKEPPKIKVSEEAKRLIERAKKQAAAPAPQTRAPAPQTRAPAPQTRAPAPQLPAKAAKATKATKAAKETASKGIRNVVAAHESKVRDKVAETSEKLRRAGVSEREIARREKAVEENLPSTVAKKAAEEKRTTGRVSPSTQKKLKQASEPIKREVEQAAKPLTDAVNRQAEELLRNLPPQMRKASLEAAKSLVQGKLDPKQLLALGEEEGKRLLSTYANKYGQQAISRLLPPGTLPSGIDPSQAVGLVSDLLRGKKVTAERIAQAGYSAVKAPLENLIQSEIGIPIKLPERISFKDIAGTLASVVPQNFEQALDLGLSVGSQVAAGALSSILAGTAIGSVIPGLGTLVGLGVGLAVFALKDAVKNFFTDKPSGRCKNENPKIECVRVPRNLPPIELIVWSAEQRKRIKPMVDRQQSTQVDCRFGEGPACLSFISNVSDRAFDLTVPRVGDIGDTLKQVGATGKSYAVGRGPRFYPAGTPAQLGLPEVNRLISLYERAPREYQGKEIDGSNVYGHIDYVLRMLKQRKAELEAFLKKSFDPLTFPTELLKEVEKATIQYGISRSSNAKKWLIQVLEKNKAFNTARARKQEELQKNVNTLYARGEQLKSEWERQCRSGDRAACAKLRPVTGVI